jgi:hypothetical protein
MLIYRQIKWQGLRLHLRASKHHVFALTKGKFAIVDAWNYEWLNRYRWFAMRGDRTFYAIRNDNGRTVLMHREIVRAPKGVPVDHINGYGLNNRQSNLRLCTPGQNNCNRGPQQQQRISDAGQAGRADRPAAISCLSLAPFFDKFIGTNVWLEKGSPNTRQCVWGSPGESVGQAPPYTSPSSVVIPQWVLT